MFDLTSWGAPFWNKFLFAFGGFIGFLLFIIGAYHNYTVRALLRKIERNTRK